MKEILKMFGGEFEIKVYKDQSDYEKDIVQSYSKVHNKMTTVSLAVISGLVGNTGSQNAFIYLELGTSSTAVSSGHTALQAAITDTGLARAAATVSRITINQTNDTLQLTYAWTATGSKTIEEVGVFNASSSGVMLCRALTSSHSIVNGTVFTITYKWTVVGN